VTGRADSIESSSFQRKGRRASGGGVESAMVKFLTRSKTYPERKDDQKASEGYSEHIIYLLGDFHVFEDRVGGSPQPKQKKEV